MLDPIQSTRAGADTGVPVYKFDPYRPPEPSPAELATESPKRKHAREKFQEGMGFFDADEHQKALECFESALERDAAFDQCWYYKAYALAYLGLLEEAPAALDRAIQVNPRHAHAWFHKGLLLRDKGKHQEAIGCFDRVLELIPDFENAWQDKSFCLGKLSRYEDALACCQRALQLNPTYEKALDNRKWLLYQLRPRLRRYCVGGLALFATFSLLTFYLAQQGFSPWLYGTGFLALLGLWQIGVGWRNAARHGRRMRESETVNASSARASTQPQSPAAPAATLRSSDESPRAGAQARDVQSVPALIAALGDETRGNSAAAALSAIGFPAVAPLAEALNDEGVWYGLNLALIVVSGPSAVALTELLKGEDRAVHQAALALMGACGGESLSAWAAALKRVDHTVQNPVIQSTCQKLAAAAIPILARAVTEKTKRLVDALRKRDQTAVRSMIRRKPETRTALVSLLAHAEQTVRIEAGAALVATENPPLALLVKALSEERLRVDASSVLKHIGAPAVPALVQLLKDESTREAAGTALVMMGRKVMSALFKAADDPSLRKEVMVVIDAIKNS